MLADLTSLQLVQVPYDGRKTFHRTSQLIAQFIYSGPLLLLSLFQDF